jgi:regulator of replication initiation timing
MNIGMPLIKENQYLVDTAMPFTTDVLSDHLISADQFKKEIEHLQTKVAALSQYSLMLCTDILELITENQRLAAENLTTDLLSHVPARTPPVIYARTDPSTTDEFKKEIEHLQTNVAALSAYSFMLCRDIFELLQQKINVLQAPPLLYSSPLNPGL